MNEPFTLSTPVLLVVFNRPAITERVMATIRQARPPRLYVAADGPRADRPGEADTCAETRRIATQVDWECTVHTLFQDENVGCGLSVSGAVSWLFAHEETGIILEDDCIPNPSFFPFCQEMLERYRHDTRVMHVSGTNMLKGWQRDPDYSYYFSAVGTGWGWATWRRAWQHYDLHVPQYPELVRKGYFKDFMLNHDDVRYITEFMDALTGPDPQLDAWDHQWEVIKFAQSGLSIVPQLNLVTNIGFGADATHTGVMSQSYVNASEQMLLFPLRHPPFVLRDRLSDERYFQQLYARSPLHRAKDFVRSLLPDPLVARIKKALPTRA